MCPLWPFHFIIIYAVLFALFYSVCKAYVPSVTEKLNVSFYPPFLKIYEYQTEIVYYQIEDLNCTDFDKCELEIYNERPEVANVDGNKTFDLYNLPYLQESWSRNFSLNVTGKFLGHTFVRIGLNKNGFKKISNSLKVSVLRKPHLLDKIFAYSVAALVAIIYVNMGCTIDTVVIKSVLRKPIAPFIGLICQYAGMPLISFGLARLLLNLPELQLGLFATGCSPGGGASNMWTLLLGGNLHLSLTMTSISTIFAFAMMPLWFLTLGNIILKEGELHVPYMHVASMLLTLIVPLFIGYLIQRNLPRVERCMVRILRPLSICLILYIIIFGLISNAFLIKLFSWQIIVSGLSLPWLGFLLGYVISKCSRFSVQDIIAIAIETGIQNTGISIFVLRFSLPQPDSDLSTVVPVAVATMTPLPLIILWIFIKCMNSQKQAKKNFSLVDDRIENRADTPTVYEEKSTKEKEHIYSISK